MRCRVEIVEQSLGRPPFDHALIVEASREDILAAVNQSCESREDLVLHAATSHLILPAALVRRSDFWIEEIEDDH